MRTLPSALNTHVQTTTTRLTLCWMVTRTDGVVIRGTTHDRDIPISSSDLAGLYAAQAGITGSAVRSSSDLAVDNLEVDGAVSGDLSIVDLTAADIEAGLLDDAEAILFTTNWEDPDGGQVVLRSGQIGNITRTSEGQYRAELRGLTQRLRQIVVRTYGVKCDAELGDPRCGVSLVGLNVSGIVTAVTSRRWFDADLTGGSSPAAGDFVGGLLEWLSGDNDGFTMEVKRDAVDAVLGHIELYEMMPVDVQIGDTFVLQPGCDKSFATCRDRFNNASNFRGFPLIPGRNKIVRYGET